MLTCCPRFLPPDSSGETIWRCRELDGPFWAGAAQAQLGLLGHTTHLYAYCHWHCAWQSQPGWWADAAASHSVVLGRRWANVCDVGPPPAQHSSLFSICSVRQQPQTHCYGTLSSFLAAPWQLLSCHWLTLCGLGSGKCCLLFSTDPCTGKQVEHPCPLVSGRGIADCAWLSDSDPRSNPGTEAMWTNTIMDLMSCSDKSVGN